MIFREHKPELTRPLVKSMSAGMLAQYNAVARLTYVFGTHDLVSPRFLQNAILMNAGLVRESVFADDRFVALNVQAGEFADQATDGENSPRVDPGFGFVEIATHFQGHDDLFHRSVARAFANSVDGTFDLPRSRLDCGQRVGHRQTKIVVTVHTNDRLVDVRHVFQQIPNQFCVLLRHL